MECILYDNGPIEPVKIYQDTSKVWPNVALFWTMWIFRTHFCRNKKYLVALRDFSLTVRLVGVLENVWTTQ